MARRMQPGGTSKANLPNLGTFVRSLFGKVVLLVFILVIVVIGIPVFSYGLSVGGNVLPGVTRFFTSISAPKAAFTPTPLPPLSEALPQPGSVSYTVQDGDSCVSILAFAMHMDASGTVFSDSKPETVQALNETLKQDCHALQPGMVLSLSPHYPLVAVGGTVLKIESSTPQQVLPTPLIQVQQPDDGQAPAADCSGGCKLTVRLNSQAQTFLSVETDLPVRIGSWVWAQAMLPRKSVSDFADYPYTDPGLSYNGMMLRACDFQVDNQHDDQSALCQQLKPNTIVTDEGSWLLGVTGQGALDHWHYPINVPAGTRVLLWLTLDHGELTFKPGNDVYRYNETRHLYEKL
jgi:hypothetical protein